MLDGLTSIRERGGIDSMCIGVRFSNTRLCVTAPTPASHPFIAKSPLVELSGGALCVHVYVCVRVCVCVAVRLLGVSDPQRRAARTATFAVSKAGLSPAALASRLCERGIWTTSGNHYAGLWSEHSGGLATTESGMARLGFLHYNTVEEVERVLAALREC